jgi:hypothetical protein
VRVLGRYWGYLLLLALIAAWWSTEIGPAALILLSALTTAYFVFRVPVWCGALNRDGTLCRRNSYGLMFGCSIRQHKWQRLKMTLVPRAWSELNRGLWSNPTTSLATASTLLGILSITASLATAVIG